MAVDVDHPERDRRWNAAARNETETQRLDRNWSSLLQELRVVQTGVQLLTGLLLTLPFQIRFDRLDSVTRVVYLATVASSIGATVLLITPIGLHRLMFRHHRLSVVVANAHRAAYAGIILLGVALTGVAVVIFDAVLGFRPAVIAGACTGAVLIGFWVVLPYVLRIRAGRPAGDVSSPR